MAGGIQRLRGLTDARDGLGVEGQCSWMVPRRRLVELTSPVTICNPKSTYSNYRHHQSMRAMPLKLKLMALSCHAWPGDTKNRFKGWVLDIRLLYPGDALEEAGMGRSRGQ
eukprot:756862-Hanusia_phi.AAC.3